MTFWAWKSKQVRLLNRAECMIETACCKSHLKWLIFVICFSQLFLKTCWHIISAWLSHQGWRLSTQRSWDIVLSVFPRWHTHLVAPTGHASVSCTIYLHATCRLLQRLLQLALSAHCHLLLLHCGDGGGNTTEENSSIFSYILLQSVTGMLGSKALLQFLTWGARKTDCPV